MSAYRLHRGLHVRLQGQGECVIEKRLPNGSLQLKNVATNQYTSVTEEKLIDALFSGALDLLGESNGSSLSESRTTRNLASELSLLSEPIKEEVKRRFAYVNAVKLAAVECLTTETLSPIVKKVSCARNDQRPPSCITLYRWCRRYKTADEDLMSLTPAIKKRGNTNSKFVIAERYKSDTVAKVITAVIEEKYLSKERHTIAGVHAMVVSRIAAKNEFRDAEDQLPIPHPNSIYKTMKKLDPYIVMKARFGARIADEKYKPVGIGVRPTRPLERVEIDHTPLDLMVVDPVMRLPVGRPTLTTVIDKYTRVLLGKYMSFDPPSYLSVMQCLRHAIAPKNYVREKYPSIVNTWDAFGIPETIVVDNAPEFYSKHFEDACLQLGINISYTPPKKGSYKGTMERWFRTQNHQLLHHQPGTTFSNIFDRADYDPKKNAVITMDALEEITHKYIVDVYHQDEHKGISDIPARLWTEAIAVYPPALPPQHTALDVLLGCIEERTITARGIELFVLHYNDDALALLRRKLKTGEKVLLKYDPIDLSLIHVADKKNGIYIPVPAVDQRYTQGLSLWQHKVIKAFARRRIKENLDIVALSRAKQEIQEIVEREWFAAKRTTARQKLARMKNHGNENRLQMRELSTSQDKFALVSGKQNASLLITSSSTTGIADFGKTTETKTASVEQDTEAQIHILNKQAVAVQVKAKKPTNRSNSRHKQDLQSKSSCEVNASAANIILIDENPIVSGIENDDLDMTGWEADYDLPS